MIGGFLDAAGGGGWGPVVTSNLLVQGAHPRKVIGTVNTAEFFLSVTISATFIASLGFEAFTKAMAGLLIGGLAAAPLGGYFAKRIPAARAADHGRHRAGRDQRLRHLARARLKEGQSLFFRFLFFLTRARTIRRAASAGRSRHRAHIRGGAWR